MVSTPVRKCGFDVRSRHNICHFHPTHDNVMLPSDYVLLSWESFFFYVIALRMRCVCVTFAVCIRIHFWLCGSPLSHVSFNAYALHLCDGCSMRIKLVQYSSSLVSTVMRMRSSDVLRDPCSIRLCYFFDRCM